MPKWVSFIMILLVPIIIIVGVLMLTQGWPISSFRTIAVWLITWLVCMTLVTVLYLWLIIGVGKNKHDSDEK
ncbi:hypothetical protein [Secundilactobacillus malefermentans]|uniref:hypothetical protein n=1 Tax=Secundilactobacillus malefermentans TaxID=176292 RepID=UPI0011C72D92|nr:hypothetical protein [Secundilactobacillus malefermentans]QEA30781.1 hypothetical protein FGL90_00500 [Secundilactobacillus malefermentans]